jgi:2-keto-4-pentenoate hydratase/2-oxohepta-3-ene-1,7-dioic acid hydratase in catechol pathway
VGYTAQRLVRFLARDGRTYYGDAILPSGVSDIAKATHAKVIKGDIFSNPTVTDQIADIRLLLAPLAREDIRTVRCLGLNYEQHAKESGMPLPKFPVLFYKPVTSIGGPFDTIPVPAPALEVDGLDYECELVAVIGKEASEVSESNALDYVLGYAVGNDISHREWQLKRGGGQWALGKGFDGWAPMGPGIVSTSLIRDPQALNILTKVNGKIVQNSSTKDIIFGVAKTIAFLSKGRCPWSPLPRNFFLKGNAEPQTGTTLLPGDLIFTGT